MKASLRTVGAIGLFVNDMKKMISFYRDVMGYPIEWYKGVLAIVELANGIYVNLLPRKEMNKGLSGQFTYPNGINGSFEICLDAGIVDFLFHVKFHFPFAKPLDKYLFCM